MEEWESAVDGEAGSKILRMMPGGIYVITSRDERGPHAMTASWVMQVAKKPPMLAVAVDRQHTTAALIAKSQVFAVNLLPKDRADIAERCFTPYQRLGHVEPFADYTTGSTGAPLLTDALATLECRVIQAVEPGDHILFIGQVVALDLRREEPPLTLDDAGWHYGR
jgi:flavin reductase (DIM6/NTAB) family NADH-FMN oxidoreductase RutF